MGRESWGREGDWHREPVRLSESGEGPPCIPVRGGGVEDHSERSAKGLMSGRCPAAAAAPPIIGLHMLMVMAVIIFS